MLDSDDISGNRRDESVKITYVHNIFSFSDEIFIKYHYEFL